MPTQLAYPPKVIGLYKVKTNELGLRQKLDMMKKIINDGAKNPDIHYFVRRLLRDCGVAPKDQRGEINCVFNYVKNNIQYRRDPFGVELFQTAPYTLFTVKAGDCDDQVIAVLTLLKNLGYRTRSSAIQTTNADNYNHVFGQVEYPRGSNKWLSLDTTVEQAPVGWEAPGNVIAKRVDNLNGLSDQYGYPYPYPLQLMEEEKSMGDFYSDGWYNDQTDLSGIGLPQDPFSTVGNADFYSDNWFNNQTDLSGLPPTAPYGMGGWDPLGSAKRLAHKVGNYITSVPGRVESGLMHPRDAWNTNKTAFKKDVAAIYKDIDHLQLPEFMRNSDVGRYLTEKAKEAEAKLAGLNPFSPFRLFVVAILAGQIPAAVILWKEKKDAILRDSPRGMSNFIKKMERDIPLLFEGSKKPGMHGLGDDTSQAVGLFARISEHWKKMSTGSKIGVIAIVICAIALYVICLMYCGCTMAGVITWASGGAVAAATAGALGPWVFYGLLAFITYEIYRLTDTGDPPIHVTPPAPTQQPPPDPNNHSDPNHAAPGAMFGLTEAGMFGGNTLFYMAGAGFLYGLFFLNKKKGASNYAKH